MFQQERSRGDSNQQSITFPLSFHFLFLFILSGNVRATFPFQYKSFLIVLIAFPSAFLGPAARLPPESPALPAHMCILPKCMHAHSLARCVHSHSPGVQAYSLTRCAHILLHNLENDGLRIQLVPFSKLLPLKCIIILYNVKLSPSSLNFFAVLHLPCHSAF